MNRTVIIQTNYIPWKGYFDMLAQAGTVVFLDTVQSTKNDWRNRNQIKTPAGKLWLTIPTRHSAALRVREVEIAAPDWSRKHLRSLLQNYAKAPALHELAPRLGEWYAEAGEMQLLSMVNRFFIDRICGWLGITARFLDAADLIPMSRHDALDPSRRLVALCGEVGATSYLTGPAARAYLDQGAFEAANIPIEWFDYSDYPPYPQLHGEFDHAVSILDVLLMTGRQARRYAIRQSSPEPA